MEEKELEKQFNTITISEQEVKKENLLEDLPNLDDLLKTEKDVKIEADLKGLTNVEPRKLEENRTFKSKQDEKRIFMKKRLKLATTIYICVAVLLFGFVIFNTATLAILNKGINSNSNTINVETEIVKTLENISQNPEDPSSTIEISLNEPRDYNDDTKELTLWDKISILFRNIFG